VAPKDPSDLRSQASSFRFAKCLACVQDDKQRELMMAIITGLFNKELNVEECDATEAKIEKQVFASTIKLK
jgi:hypothetical protein